MNDGGQEQVPRTRDAEPPSRVIPVTESHTQALASVLSRALCDEPYFTYMVPNDSERRSVLPRFLKAIIDISRVHGESYTTADIEGGAVWIKSDQAQTLHRRVWARLRETNFTLSETSLRRCIRLRTRLEHVRRLLARRPHWYLIALGLDPARERSSTRKALLRPVLYQADVDGYYCYLEILQKKSLSFYEEQGFCIEGCGQISQSGPAFWSMIRAPRR